MTVILALVLLVRGMLTAATVDYTPPPSYLQRLPSPYPMEPSHGGWERELWMGQSFGRELDLYRAITALKRARYLMQHEGHSPLAADYDLLLAYYLAGKPNEVVSIFEGGSLEALTPEQPAYGTLVPLLYDTYVARKEPHKAQTLLQLASPDLAQRLRLSTALRDGDIVAARRELATLLPVNQQLHDPTTRLLSDYEMLRKSPGKAGLLQAVLPGAGYMYIGQVQSGITSLLLNVVFVAAAWRFFEKGYVAAGAITAGVEVGWYVGGIRGAALGAHEYNDRLYRERATPVMADERLFPILMVQYGF